MRESIDSQDRDVGAKTPMSLGDARKSGQRRKNFRGVTSRESEAGHNQSARVVTGSISTTANRVNCSWCGSTGHKRHKRSKQVSVGAKPGTQAGREARAANLSSSGRGMAGSRKRTGHVTSSWTEELQAIR